MSKNQCLLQVVTYLPHLLLAGGDYGDGDAHGENLFQGAFSLVLVEKSFLAIFSANHKVKLLFFLRLYRPSEQWESSHFDWLDFY